ncbi:MAG: ABC transporter ATP-binding protein [Candidatus Metalachnospira sp.]|nr:ABC transporter ATP-binding protein [Candidatus Metalachnospira sp.]
MESILELNDLHLSFYTPIGEIEAVRGINLELNKGEILAVVGESGCGKSVMSKTVLKLLPRNAKIKNGSIIYNGENITDYDDKKMQKIRGKEISMVFQDPMSALNPTVPIGKQISEAILKHEKCSKENAKKRAIEMLELVGIDDPINRYNMQPHFFSGGMRQRCVLAIALSSNPKVLIADEPTTSLDVTVQAKILDLLMEIRDKTGISIIFISHDFGVVAKIADRIAVMYAGKIVEVGTSDEIFYDPRHPYTWGLLASLPYFAKKGQSLKSIPGMPPIMINLPKGDVFASRNSYALEIDFEEGPPMFDITDTHRAATWLLDPRAPKVDAPIAIKGA